MGKRVLNRAIAVGNKQVEDNENAVFADKEEGGSLRGISVYHGRDLRVILVAADRDDLDGLGQAEPLAHEQLTKDCSHLLETRSDFVSLLVSRVG